MTTTANDEWTPIAPLRGRAATPSERRALRLRTQVRDLRRRLRVESRPVSFEQQLNGATVFCSYDLHSNHVRHELRLLAMEVLTALDVAELDLMILGPEPTS